MGFKHKDFVEYKRHGEIVEFITRDQSGAKTGTFKATNQKDYSKVLRIIRDKTGYKPEIKLEDSPNFDDEIKWLKKDMEW